MKSQIKSQIKPQEKLPTIIETSDCGTPHPEKFSLHQGLVTESRLVDEDSNSPFLILNKHDTKNSEFTLGKKSWDDGKKTNQADLEYTRMMDEALGSGGMETGSGQNFTEDQQKNQRMKTVVVPGQSDRSLEDFLDFNGQRNRVRSEGDILYTGVMGQAKDHGHKDLDVFRRIEEEESENDSQCP